MDNYTFRPPLDLEEVSFLLPYTSEATCRAATSITYTDYAHAPHYVWGNKNRISPRCCPTMDKTFSREYETLLNFTVSEDCISCGLCEKLCPSGIIKLENGKPVWTSDKCAFCLGCLHRCPKFAIQFGSKTKKHGQFYNPRVR